MQDFANANLVQSQHFCKHAGTFYKQEQYKLFY